MTAGVRRNGAVAPAVANHCELAAFIDVGVGDLSRVELTTEKDGGCSRDAGGAAEVPNGVGKCDEKGVSLRGRRELGNRRNLSTRRGAHA
jgi:hypothetical protein